MGTPFDEEFDIDGGDEIDLKFDDENINDTEQAKLVEMKKYALQAFRIMMGQMHLISGDQLIKFNETAQKWLVIAQDAEHKSKKLEIDLQRVKNSAKVGTTPKQGTEESHTSNTGGAMSRNDLYSLKSPGKLQ